MIGLLIGTVAAGAVGVAQASGALNRAVGATGGSGWSGGGHSGGGGGSGYHGGGTYPGGGYGGGRFQPSSYYGGGYGGNYYGYTNNYYPSLYPGIQNFTYVGGTVIIQLPPGATSWVSVNGQPMSGNSPLQLPASPTGTWTFVYLDSMGMQQTSTLVV